MTESLYEAVLEASSQPEHRIRVSRVLKILGVSKVVITIGSGESRVIVRSGRLKSREPSKISMMTASASMEHLRSQPSFIKRGLPPLKAL